MVILPTSFKLLTDGENDDNVMSFMHCVRYKKDIKRSTNSTFLPPLPLLYFHPPL